MADPFGKQSKQYAETRPSYPPELFDFIASRCPGRDLAWDVGTGNGQAAVSLAHIFTNVVATDTSQRQLAYATKLPNIRYEHTPPVMSLADLSRNVVPPRTVDLITVATAIHWFDRKAFYEQVHHVLRPGGILAAWCYNNLHVDARVDSVLDRILKGSVCFWAPQRRFVDEELRTIEFPFEPVEGEVHTGPFEFEARKEMDLEKYKRFITSWSTYQTAKGHGVELLTDEVVEELERAWGGDREAVKVVRFPIFLRLGRVNNKDANLDSSNLSLT